MGPGRCCPENFSDFPVGTVKLLSPGQVRRILGFVELKVFCHGLAVSISLGAIAPSLARLYGQDSYR